jgi:hypothetical protein
MRLIILRRVVLLGALARQTGEGGDSIATSNKDMTDIRKSRQDVGCNCRPLKLDKLSVGKLKQELLSYERKVAPSGSGLDPLSPEVLTAAQIEAMPKNELLSRLRERVKSCPICVSNDCACIAAGIGCHGNVCGCSRNSAGLCQNPEGMESYDPKRVSEYRANFVSPSAPLPPGRPARSNSA